MNIKQIVPCLIQLKHESTVRGSLHRSCPAADRLPRSKGEAFSPQLRGMPCDHHEFETESKWKYVDMTGGQGHTWLSCLTHGFSFKHKTSGFHHQRFSWRLSRRHQPPARRCWQRSPLQYHQSWRRGAAEHRKSMDSVGHWDLKCSVPWIFGAMDFGSHWVTIYRRFQEFTILLLSQLWIPGNADRLTHPINWEPGRQEVIAHPGKGRPRGPGKTCMDAGSVFFHIKENAYINQSHVQILGVFLPLLDCTKSVYTIYVYIYIYMINYDKSWNRNVSLIDGIDTLAKRHLQRHRDVSSDSFRLDTNMIGPQLSLSGFVLKKRYPPKATAHLIFTGVAVVKDAMVWFLHLQGCHSPIIIIIWRFPKIGVQPNHSFFVWHVPSYINHPAIGDFPFVETSIPLNPGWFSSGFPYWIKLYSPIYWAV